ncbi:macrophage mannose receptor 1-like isoform X1 [Macrobrachium rosenbergii]|uniref:macrophage mannose receptor 1-like isoform X1 n=1 Tax=Macrobrachium rosenbergii TaxID=79674 RepID=UPI0034D56A71
MKIRLHTVTTIFMSTIGILTACEDGWVEFRECCYFYSGFNSDPKKNEENNQPDTSIKASSDTHSSYGHPAVMSYTEAQAECARKGSQLPSLSTTEETEFIDSLIADPNSIVWIGNTFEALNGRGEDSQERHSKKLQLSSAMDKTAASSPETSCAFMNSTRKRITFTNICEKQHFYICMKPKQRGRENKSRQKRYYPYPLFGYEQRIRFAPHSDGHGFQHPFFRRPPLFQSRFSSPFARHPIEEEESPNIFQQRVTTKPPLILPLLQNVQHRLGLLRPGKGNPLALEEPARTLGFNPLLSDEPRPSSKEKDSVLINPSATLLARPQPQGLGSESEHTTNTSTSTHTAQTPSSPTEAKATLTFKKQSQITTSKGSTCREDEVFYSTSCYAMPDPMHKFDFESAFLSCQENNGKLIIINNDAEEAFLAKLTKNTSMSFWVGLRNNSDIRAARLQWIDGTPVISPEKYTANGESEGQCMSVANTGNESLTWTLKDCAENLTYVCEREERPVVRLAEGCLEGWEDARSRCYKVFSKPASWTESERHCTTFGAHLASAGSVEEEDILRRLSQSTFVSDFFSSVWIGLEISSESNYSWTDNTPRGYLNWAEGQPDFHQAKEHCGSATRASFTIHDSPCSAFLPFICEATPGSMVVTKQLPQKKPNSTCEDDPSWLLFNKHCYKIIPSDDNAGDTWFESRRLCREIGGELASIHTVEENYWLQSQVHSVRDNVLWIGGLAYWGSGYEWADGTAFDYSNWAKGEPNNYYDQEDCIALYTRDFGYWNDQNCGHKQGRICKRALWTMHGPQVTTPVPEGNCPEGWIHTGIKCLKFFKAMVTFDIARKACKKLSGRAELASISSVKEQAYVTAALGELKMNMWLGLRYEQGFHWLDQSALTYTNWAQGEPNSKRENLNQGWLNEDRNENCVNTHISNLAGQWNDINCEALNGYICQITPDSSQPSSNPFQTCSPPFDNYIRYNNKCYRVEATVKTWKEAEMTCRNEGGHLASAANKAESSWLWVLAQQYSLENPWTGCNNLADPKVFQWSDAWPTLYTQWGKGEPNISSANHSCSTLNSETGLWFLENCDEERNFICKYTPETPLHPTHPLEEPVLLTVGWTLVGAPVIT